MRRTAAALAAAALAAAAATASAAAAPPGGFESFGAGARASAGQLTVGGQTLALATSHARVDSSDAATGPRAAADGVALVTPALASPGAPSAAPQGPASNRHCAAELPEPLRDLVSLQAACVDTTASLEGGPHATGLSGEILLSLRTAPVIADTPLGEVVEQVRAGLSQGLGQLAGRLPEQVRPQLEESISPLLEEIIAGLGTEDPVLEVKLAPTSTSAQATDAEGVRAGAAAHGAEIRLFPKLQSGPLVTITVGSSDASAQRAPGAGAPAATAAPALVEVAFGGSLKAINDLLAPVAGGQHQLSAASLPCDATNPLAGLVCVELASASEMDQAALQAAGLWFGPGTTGARASAVRLQVLGVLAEQLGGAGVGISLAETQAAANAIPARALPQDPAEEPPAQVLVEQPQQVLPRTGGSALALGVLAASLGAAAALGLALGRRAKPLP